MQEIQKVKEVQFSVIKRNAIVNFDPLKRDLKDFLQGSVHVEIIRKEATKVLGKDIDLKQTEQIDLSRLPDDIKQDLIDIYYRIEKLL